MRTSRRVTPNPSVKRTRNGVAPGPLTSNVMTEVLMLRLLLLLGLLFPVVTTASETTGSYGYYDGTVVAKWLPDGRSMKLLSPFAYIALNKVIWIAPTGAVVDGASIPKFAWSIIGGPFEGKYRNASVIHDVACEKKNRTWRATHSAFYTGMLASGVDATLAKVMYAAVYHFGPRWNVEISMVGVELPKAQKEINKVLATHGSSAYGVRMKTQKYAIADSAGKTPALVDIDLTLIDLSTFRRPRLTEAHFKKLEKNIRVNNISIAQIEDFGKGLPR